MTARCFPETPAFATQSEEYVWRQLREELDDDAVLLANLRLTNEAGDHEIDLLVMLPDAGMIVIEVKGRGVEIHEHGQWWLRTPTEDKRVDPAEQVLRGKYELRAFIEGNPSWGRDGVRWAHAVVLPFTRLGPDFSQPDLPRWIVHDLDDMPHLVGRLRHQVNRQENDRHAPTVEDVDKALEIWMSRTATSADLVTEADEREAVATAKLTQEQALLLKVTRLLNRVEIRGGAGSGKTVMATTQARALTTGSGTDGQKAQRVALICYSRGLASYLQRQVQAMPRRARPAYVGTFHGLGMQWGAPDGDRNNSHFWEVELPTRMLELAHGLDPKEKFDAIVVDEAQDFATSWWEPVLAALRDPDEGGLYIYSDENQRLFPRFGPPPIAFVPLILDHNLRNTQQIAKAFGPLAPSQMRPLGGSGPEVEFVQAGAEDAVNAADDQVDLLLDEGWEPGHVALITTRSRHPQQRALQESRGEDGYWESFWEEDDVFYGTVLGCKGMERRAVVLCVNSDHLERARERLYVGMSRATDRLVVVGDAAHIRAVGGEQVARRLGVGPTPP